MSNYIEIINKKDCCGCEACYNLCSQKSISMIIDDEGFFYPQIDRQTCIACGRCKKVCPVLNVEPEVAVNQKAFIVQHINPKILFESTSGGAFTGIADEIIKKGGVVFGAVLSDDLIVKHGYSETSEDLAKFRNSKYVQSQMDYTYAQAAEFLKQGRYVCFSGTPCQIEGLIRFLLIRGIQHQRLITIDVVCHAIPSISIYMKYLELRNSSKDLDEIQKIRWRDKAPYGYKYSQMAHYNKDGKVIYHSGVQSDYMLRAFFSNICDRPSCYDCRFKKRYRISDITIWDCFNPSVYDRSFDNDKGVSHVLIHTDNGQQLFDGIASLRKQEILPDKACADAKLMTNCVSINPRRNSFFKDSKVMDNKEFFKKYFPDTVKTKIERIGRKACIRLGFYKPVLRLVQKVGLWSR